VELTEKKIKVNRKTFVVDIYNKINTRTKKTKILWLIY